MSTDFSHKGDAKYFAALAVLIVFCAAAIADVAVVMLYGSGLVDLAVLVWTLAFCGV